MIDVPMCKWAEYVDISLSFMVGLNVDLHPLCWSSKRDIKDFKLSMITGNISLTQALTMACDGSFRHDDEYWQSSCKALYM